MDIDPLAGIGNSSNGSSDSKQTKKYLKLGNKNISGVKHACYGNLFNTSTKEQVQLDSAVILYVSTPRSYTLFRQGQKPETKCESITGLEPAARIPSPFCNKSTVADVAEYLTERAELYNIGALNEAKIKEITDEVCKDGNLTTCGYTHKGQFYPLCIHAIPDGSKKCKPQLRLHCYDLQAEELLYIDISPSNLHAKKDWPLVNFIRMVKKEGYPIYHWSVTLNGHIPDDGYVKLGVEQAQRIEVTETLAKLKGLADKEKEGIQVRNKWKPEDKSSPNVGESEGSGNSDDEMIDLELEEGGTIF